MSTPLNAEELARALQSEGGLPNIYSAEGLVRKTTDPHVVEFSPSHPVPLCLVWLKIPLKMIEKVQLLGKRQCLDHLHDYVLIYFKRPESAEAAVFAELLHHQATAGGSTMTAAVEPVMLSAAGVPFGEVMPGTGAPDEAMPPVSAAEPSRGGSFSGFAPRNAWSGWHNLPRYLNTQYNVYINPTTIPGARIWGRVIYYDTRNRRRDEQFAQYPGYGAFRTGGVQFTPVVAFYGVNVATHLNCWYYP
jgi:hypothetical protein